MFGSKFTTYADALAFIKANSHTVAYDVAHMVPPSRSDIRFITIQEVMAQGGGPQAGSARQGIRRAWRQEMELVELTGRGTAHWSDDQISTIRRMYRTLQGEDGLAPFTPSELKTIRFGEGFTLLGYTGHHINMVETHPLWKWDPRNIAFLEVGSGNAHMVLGHPGGTKVKQPGSSLIDREAMLVKARQDRKDLLALWHQMAMEGGGM